MAFLQFNIVVVSSPVYKNSRRDFLQKISLAGLVTLGMPPLINKAFSSPNNKHQKKENLVFLFQGDSITDGNRGRNNDPNHIMGHGYAFSIASRVGTDFPKKNLRFYNRGISGNKIADLNARWQKDALDIKPDVLSILVGVNDVEASMRQKETVVTEKFEETYRMLLNQTRAQLPECLFVVCEPFILPVGRVKDNWIEWKTEMQKIQSIVARLAKEYSAVFVPLQTVFDNAAARVTPEYWIWDGIHPTVAGHELITRQWLKQVGKKIDFLKKYN